jgi:vacuolar-type H+-ATPase subunit F/Vma7
MASVYYIGDEATACGYRLAGAETRVPGPAETAEVFRRAVADGADLILLSAAIAGELGVGALDDALAGTRPLVAIVPDVLGRHPAPDVAREVRLALGIES